MPANHWFHAAKIHTHMQGKILVVNVTAVSFSGSTWLNLMLGSHPEAFSVGELKKVLEYEKPVCSIHGEPCPLWSQFNHPSDENPFLQLSRLSGKRVLIVNKSRKFLPFQKHPQIESRFIHLVRDNRAVLASFLRKNPQMTTLGVSWWLAHDLRRNLRLHRRQPAKHVIHVQYEKLQQDPEAELRRLCDFLGISYDPAMLEFWKPEHHFIAGNRGTLFGMLRKGEQSVAPEQALVASPDDGQKWEVSQYRKVDAARFEDERWKSELTDKQLRIFDLIAGRINRRFGYPRKLDRPAGGVTGGA